MIDEAFCQKSDSYFTLPQWGSLDPHIVVGMSTRNGGESRSPFHTLNMGLHVNDNPKVVIENRRKLANELKIPLENWIFCEQVHGNNIQKVTSDDRNSGTESLDTVIKGVDGLYTGDKQVVLATLYADCVPIYFFAPNYQLIGVAHAGWRGSVGNIVGKMVKEWINVEKVPKSEIYAAIGPSIGKNQYEVDENVITEVDNILDNNDVKPYTKTKVGKFLLNLKLLNRQLLLKAGVNKDNLLESTYCTSSRNDLFFSYRKENGMTGRMVSFIGLRE